jgi:hypothetical protein
MNPADPTAGPSRPPRSQQIVRPSPTRSQSAKSHLARIDANHLSPITPTSPSSMRRVLSYEDTRNTPVPPPLPPKDNVSPTDPLFRAARVKVSGIDQEAMRKLRSTMVEYSGDEGSSRSHSTSTSPVNPMFPAGRADVRSRGSRRSTLSKVIVQDDEDRNETTPVASSSVRLRQ